MRRRTCWWEDALDTDWVDNLEMEHIRHKALWKNLHLEPTLGYVDVQDDGVTLVEAQDVQQDPLEGMAGSKDLQSGNNVHTVQSTHKVLGTVQFDMQPGMMEEPSWMTWYME